MPVGGDWGAASSLIWADMLEVRAPDVRVLMRYGFSDGWLDGQPAVVTRAVGRGRITYIGADLDADGLKHAAEWMTKVSGVEPVLPEIPAGIDVAVRQGSGRRVTILINYGSTAATIALPSTMRDVPRARTFPVSPCRDYGVVILSEPLRAN